MISRLVLAVCVAATLVVALAVPASAARPAAGCPPAFTQMTFEQVLTTWPPPPGVDGEAALAFWDRNGDRSLCVQLVADPVPGPGLNVVDNVAAT